MGVPISTQESPFSCETGVPKIILNWGPGSLISYEKQGPQFREPGSPFSLDTGENGGGGGKILSHWVPPPLFLGALSLVCFHMTHACIL